MGFSAESFEKGQVLTVWVNQVMYPGAVADAIHDILFLDSVQHAGLKYKVKISSITALTIDTNTDTLEKLEAQKKAFEEKQKRDADEMRAQAKTLEVEMDNIN